MQSHCFDIDLDLMSFVLPDEVQSCEQVHSRNNWNKVCNLVRNNAYLKKLVRHLTVAIQVGKPADSSNTEE